jgi:hypothetical protein
MLAILNLNAQGGYAPSYVSYFGGQFTDVINSVAVDPADPRSLVFAGYTTSADLFTTDGSTRPNASPAPSAFVTRFQQ